MRVNKVFVFLVIGFLIVFSVGVFAQGNDRVVRIDPSDIRGDNGGTFSRDGLGGDEPGREFDDFSRDGVVRNTFETDKRVVGEDGIARDYHVAIDEVEGDGFEERRVRFENELGEDVVINNRLLREGGRESSLSVGGVEVELADDVSIRENFDDPQRSRIIAVTFSGEEREISVMPNRASVAAARALGSVASFNLQLREVDEKIGKVAYVAESSRVTNLFGIFRVNYVARAQINSITGVVEDIDRPFLVEVFGSNTRSLSSDSEVQ